MTSNNEKTPQRIFDSPHLPIPEVQLLSNGRYHVMVTSAGGGYSRWNNLAVTRWCEDAACDNWGAFCYLRDVASRGSWSTGYQPTLQRADIYEAVFSEGRAVFRRRDHDIETHTEIAVSPEDDVEVRRTRITNCSGVRRVIEITSYAEIVLAPPATDSAHPAFSKLFVETEIVRERQAILCTRRPRAPDEPAPWMFHLMVDDKLRILAAMKKILQDRLTTVFPRRGHYALDPHNLSAYPPADLPIERIGDLLNCDLPTLLMPARAVD